MKFDLNNKKNIGLIILVVIVIVALYYFYSPVEESAPTDTGGGESDSQATVGIGINPPAGDDQTNLDNEGGNDGTG